MMVLSYATIICQLNVLKLERRKLTNFSSRSYKGKNYSSQEMYTKEDQEDCMTEVLSKQQMELMSNVSDEAEREIGVDNESEELTTKLDGSDDNGEKYMIEKCFENKRCSSLKVSSKKRNTERRLSEFHISDKETIQINQQVKMTLHATTTITHTNSMSSISQLLLT